ncbi:MAG: tripartite tricarboxylate transporter substrate binding protein [Burkholderiales bacterium]|jgi:tripartite-type tricarboxylate transporter receptor subunit TctC
MDRRTAIAAAAWTLMAARGAGAQQAEAWPSRPVKIIVPAAPGGSPDALARLLSTRMPNTLKQPVLVESRPGAGGLIGARALASAQDGHTVILMVTSVAAVLPVVNPAANFDAVRDLVPVASIGYTPMMVVAAAGTPIRTFEQAVEFARKASTPPVFAHAGPGTMSHLAQQRVAKMAGMEVLSVSFGNPAKTLAGLVGGDAQLYADAVSVVMPMVQAGRAVPLAVLAPEKVPGLESVPLGRDLIPGLVAVGAFGVMAPKGTPPENVALLSRAVAEAMKDPEVVPRLREMGIFPNVTDAPAYGEILRQEQAVWGAVAKGLALEPPR